MANLLPGETVVLRRHRHWVMPVKAMALPVLLVVLVSLGADVLLKEKISGDARLIATLAVLAVAGLWAIVTWISWTSTAVTITDQRVILNAGVFSRTSKVIPIDRGQDVSPRRSLLGRVLGYGTVEIDAAGASGAEALDHVPAPDAFRDQVFLQSERLRKGPNPAPTSV